MLKRTFLSLSAAALVFTSAPLGFAAEPLLTVRNVSDGTSVSFTQEELMALPQASFDTGTIWSEGVDTYAGPTLASVLAAAQMPAGDLKLYAINDYNVDFPAERLGEDAPIVANRINGKAFSVRDKGPLWVMFPFDNGKGYNNEDTFALSVWQLKQIDVIVD